MIVFVFVKMLWNVVILVLFLQTTAAATIVSTPVQNITHCGNITCSHVSKCKDDGLGGLECVCFAGYQGHTCHDDRDECTEGHPCGYRGKCINTIGSYSCNCMTGWVGSLHCEDPDNTTDHTECVPGWTGSRCFTDINECLDNNTNTCGVHQVCINTRGSYRCECEHGWSGSNCVDDVDECIINHCENSGICTNSQGSYKCTCLTGWQGLNCTVDVNECDNNICDNSATCCNTDGSYKCECAAGWTGVKCSVDVNECTDNPCKNSGTCINNLGSYSCACAPGWQGANCNDDVDECKSIACNHSGICKNTFGSFFCACTSNWTGVYCDQAFVAIPPDEAISSNVGVIVGAVIGSVLVLGGVVVGLGIAKYKCHNTSVSSSTAVIQVEHNTTAADNNLQTEVGNEKPEKIDANGKVKEFVMRTRVSIGKLFFKH